jgi:hypothetical protein
MPDITPPMASRLDPTALIRLIRSGITASVTVRAYLSELPPMVGRSWSGLNTDIFAEVGMVETES